MSGTACSMHKNFRLHNPRRPAVDRGRAGIGSTFDVVSSQIPKPQTPNPKYYAPKPCMLLIRYEPLKHASTHSSIYSSLAVGQDMARLPSPTGSYHPPPSLDPGSSHPYLPVWLSVDRLGMELSVDSMELHKPAGLVACTQHMSSVGVGADLVLTRSRLRPRAV